jgi:methyltransferase-like protein
MALSDRDSQFVGIDLSARQIDDAKRTARELEIPNVDFRTLSILDLPEDIGRFDYILCHGVYSWVPPEVQDKILRICSEHLAPQGVGYVSYNCYPGWHTRGAIREMLWYHTQRTADPAVRIRAARGLLAFLAKFAPASDGAYGSLIHQELAVLLATPDTYLLHEHLEEFNEPLYFHQFISRAAEKGLQYLGEAAVSAMVAGKFGPEVEQILRQISPDLLHMEQYMDFLRNRMFRQTLLCHTDVKLDYSLRPEAVTRFWASSSAKPVPPADSKAAGTSEEFRGSGKLTLTTSDALMKAAMHCLAEADPLPLRFDELLAAARDRGGRDGAASPDEARQLATRLLNCYLSNLADFSLSPPGFVRDVTERPVASPYARLRAREGGKIVNLRLETVPLTAPSLLVLQHLDGRHDRAALVRLIAEKIESASAAATDATEPADEGPHEPPEVRAATYIDTLLKAFAGAALLIR